MCSEVFRWKKLVKTDEEEDQEKYLSRYMCVISLRIFPFG
jgi:hypothetical protein